MADEAGALEKLLGMLKAHEIDFCVIGGQGVNAYVEPLVSLDLDLVIAAGQIEDAVQMLSGTFKVEQSPHAINLSLPDSDLRIQIQTDPRYAAFVDRSQDRAVLGTSMPVADVRDILRSKIWAALDTARRTSKRQKDLADISRILERYPELRSEVPEEVLSRLV